MKLPSRQIQQRLKAEKYMLQVIFSANYTNDHSIVLDFDLESTELVFTVISCHA